MSNRNLIVSIDVGTTKICTTIAEAADNNKIQVAGVGISPSHGLHKGLVVNINEAKEAIRESVRKAEQSSGYKVESAYVGVTGRHVTSLNNQGVVAITRNDRLVKPDDAYQKFSDSLCPFISRMFNCSSSKGKDGFFLRKPCPGRQCIRGVYRYIGKESALMLYGKGCYSPLYEGI